MKLNRTKELQNLLSKQRNVITVEIKRSNRMAVLIGTFSETTYCSIKSNELNELVQSWRVPAIYVVFFK